MPTAHLRRSLLMLGGLCGAAIAATAAARETPLREPILPPQVERSAGAPLHQSARARHAMVAAANPLAVAAGVKMLRAGGSAVDAAVAVQAVLGLVEPQSSGLGGGSFLVFYDAKTREVTAYDGREVAPHGADPAQFVGADGHPLPFGQAVLGGIASGVPGAIAMLDMAQREHGRLKWASLFAPAARLARDGFIISPRLAGMITLNMPENTAPDVIAYFAKPDGTHYAAGDVLRNPAYADSLSTIAVRRSAGLLTGPLAEAITARTAQAPLPSTLSTTDLAAYRPHKTGALCLPWQGYTVCTPQAPSGGPALLEALGILARTDIAARGPNDADAWFTFAQASRLAYADRDRYEGDPAFVSVPVAGLLAPDYVAQRAALIGSSAGPVTWGQPKGAPAPGIDATREPGGTSHIVIVDAAGNVVSMTTTVESIFGSGRMVGGFFLNNQLTDFSFSPKAADGTAAANALAPGKRPRSSMAPIIVLDAKRRFVAAMGSPGGSSIIAYNLKALIGVLGWHLTPQQAAALPNLVAHGALFSADPFPPAIAGALARKAMPLDTARGENSGIQIILRKNGAYQGGADPRREGMARGF